MVNRSVAQGISRRQFLTIAGMTLAGSALAGCVIKRRSMHRR